MESKEIIYPLTFAQNYFISSLGCIYLMRHGHKREVVKPSIINGGIYIHIYDKPHLLLDLMLKYFFFNVKEYSSMKVNIKKGATKIPVSAILFENIQVEPNEDFVIFKYKIAQKVSSANCRSIDMITDTDIVYALKRDLFKCKYCGNKLNANHWHLDHIVPLSKRGSNHRDNITGACKMCNIMKHAFRSDEFLVKCGKIYFNNKERIDLLNEQNFIIGSNNKINTNE